MPSSDDRQAQIDRDLARFYARNPGAHPALMAEEPTGRSPLDLGTVSLDEVANAVEIPAVTDMDFMHEVLPILRKRLVWDIVPTTEEIKAWAGKLNVTPGSEEGDLVEEEGSHNRRLNLLPIQPLASITAMMAGEIVSRSKALLDNEESDGALLTLKPEHNVIEEVQGGTLAVIANLLEMDILTYGKAITGE